MEYPGRWEDIYNQLCVNPELYYHQHGQSYIQSRSLLLFCSDAHPVFCKDELWSRHSQNSESGYADLPGPRVSHLRCLLQEYPIY